MTECEITRIVEEYQQFIGTTETATDTDKIEEAVLCKHLCLWDAIKNA
jgi:hypothetical protein